MKSLILKDLYNIGHNAKSMLFMLLVLAFFLIPSAGPEAYMVMSGVLCSMMVMTTFSFDDNSKWVKYALVMPVTKKDIVAGKFIILLIFSAVGAVFGLLFGSIGGMITHKVDFSQISGFLTLLFVAMVTLVIAEIFGSMSIPLLFKFGTEKARMLSLISLIIPTAICLGVYRILIFLGVSFTDQLLFILICCSPILALIWNFVMYKISCAIFSHREEI